MSVCSQHMSVSLCIYTNFKTEVKHLRMTMVLWQTADEKNETNKKSLTQAVCCHTDAAF